jgi:hypothetical protein
MLPRFLAALAAALSASCTTFYDLQYVPAPLEVRVEDAATPELSGRALITVLGLRRADRGEDRPAQYELAMRLENLGSLPFAVEPSSLELVAANLQPFGPPALSPSPPPPLDPGATQELRLAFPLPGGRELSDYDLNGLNLRWAVRFAERTMTIGASFQRVLPPRVYAYDPYPYAPPYWRWHVGVGVGRFCRY